MSGGLRPVFTRLWKRGGADWPARLLRRCDGLGSLGEPGIAITDKPAFGVKSGDATADVLVECVHMVIWVVSSPITVGAKGQPLRDSLAAGLEGVARMAGEKDFCMVLVHDGLKPYEQALVDGYRAGTWAGGLTHSDARFRTRIGTVSRAEL
jgi:hypothetical protein